MIYKKSPLAMVVPYGADGYVIGYGSTQDVISAEKFNDISKILCFLKSEKNNDEVNDFLNCHNIKPDVFKYCCDRKLITSNNLLFEKHENASYKNHLYLEACFDNSENLIKSIQDTTFIIIGCGGIGNCLGFSFASYIPNELVLIDGDMIDISNLNRQFLFSLDDVGKYKVDVLKDKLQQRYSDLNVSKYCVYADLNNLQEIFSKVSLSSKHVFVIVSGDSEFVVQDVIRVANKFKYPTLNVGYLNDYSVIGPFLYQIKQLARFVKILQINLLVMKRPILKK